MQRKTQRENQKGTSLNFLVHIHYTRMKYTNFHPFLTVMGRALGHSSKKRKKWKFDGIVIPCTSTNLFKFSFMLFNTFSIECHKI